MRITVVALLLSLAAFAACSPHRGTPLYQSQMGDKPWVQVQERQDEVTQLSDAEQKMLTGMVSLLQRKHDATGYPQPNQTFESALRQQYGDQFDQAVRTAAAKAAAAKEQ